MRRPPVIASLLLLAGCSTLPTTGDGIIALELRVPAVLTLHLGDTLALKARALNLQGDSVGAEIRWYTPDTAAITVDSTLGTVVGKLASGSGRVQAQVGTLHSDPVTILLAPASTPGSLQGP